MSPEAALRSDHVNLLIHRYLQESGFENAAKALHVDWKRHSDYRDPETLPFAHTLHRNELISVIQAGLHYDDLRAQASKTDRKFQWTTTRERTDGYVENGASSRPSSSGRRKGHPPVTRASHDFPTPMPKRQRRSEDSDAQVNGERDAADMDAADGEADADAEGEEDVDAASPAVFSEPEAVLAERYDSVMTQTEFKSVPRTSTVHLTIDQPGAKLLEGSWNPGPEARHARTFLAVGDSVCRTYDIPAGSDDTLQVSSLTVTAQGKDSELTRLDIGHVSGRTNTIPAFCNHSNRMAPQWRSRKLCHRLTCRVCRATPNQRLVARRAQSRWKQCHFPRRTAEA